MASKSKRQFQVGSGDIVSSDAGLLFGSQRRTTPKDYKTYRAMRCDPTIAMARAAATAPIKFASWSVEGELQDETVRDALSDYFQKVQFDLVRHLLYALDYGWMALEKVWTLNERTGRMDASFRPLRHELTKVLVLEGSGEFAGLRNTASGTVDLEPRDSILFTYDGEYGDPYGRSRFENIRAKAWEPWEEVVGQLKRYHSKVSGAIPVVHYPIGMTKVAGGSTVDNSSLAKKLVESLSSLKGVALPQKFEKWAEAMLRQGANPDDLLSWKVNFIDAPSGAGGEMIATAQYYDSLKVRGYLLPERAILEGQHGTKAEAAEHGDIALGVAEETLRDIYSCLNTQLVDEWLEVNYGPQLRGALYLKPAPLSDEARVMSKQLLTTVLQDPNNGDMMQAVLDLDAMIDQFNLPRRGSTTDASVQLPQLPPLDVGGIGLSHEDQPRDEQGRWTSSGRVELPSDEESDKWIAALNKREEAAMNAWTSPIGLYVSMNNQERSGRAKVHDNMPTVADLDSALDKAPKVSGVVYRGGQLDSKSARQVKVGAEISLDVTKSASASPSVAAKFAKENIGNVIYVIKGKNMPSVSGYSKAIGEQEVLLRRNTKYRVTGKSRQNGMNIVELEQQ